MKTLYLGGPLDGQMRPPPIGMQPPEPGYNFTTIKVGGHWHDAAIWMEGDKGWLLGGAVTSLVEAYHKSRRPA